MSHTSDMTSPDSSSRPGRIGRRHVLQAGGLVTLGATLGVSQTLPAQAAELPDSSRFDLAADSVRMFYQKVLHETHHVMQGIAFDSVNKHLFISQVRNGTDNGICINRLDYSGNVTGWMHLDDAGHGISLGVESVGSDSYVWSDCDAKGGERGTALARFKFVSGAAPKITKYQTGTDQITCSIDPWNKTIMTRWHDGERFMFAVYDLDLFKQGKYDEGKLTELPVPSEKGMTFQGYTLYGRYGYILEGPPQNVDDPADLLSRLTSIDLNTKKVVQRAHTYAAYDLLDREPEGMAVLKTGDDLRLVYGLASHKAGQGINRYATLYYK